MPISLKTISATLTAISAVLIVVFVMTTPKSPSLLYEAIERDYKFRRLKLADLKALSLDYASAFETLDEDAYPVEIYGWLDYPGEGLPAVFADKRLIGKKGDANCLTGMIGPSGSEARQAGIEKFDGRYVKLIVDWRNHTAVEYRSISQNWENPCENEATFRALDVFLAKEKQKVAQ